MYTGNHVANILKVYGILNAAASIIIAFILGDELPYDLLWIIVAGTGIVFSFLIFAFGEAIQLLHDIKRNTSHKSDEMDADKLPEI